MAPRRPVKPELPRSEPEIIPPARDRTQAYGQSYGGEWFSTGGRASGGVFVAKLGPWRLIGIVLLFGLVVGAVLALVLGALLITIPIIGLVVVIGIIASQLRGHLQRPR
jgi:hypothetical protein